MDSDLRLAELVNFKVDDTNLKEETITVRVEVTKSD
jgi:hypothetical protein